MAPLRVVFCDDSYLVRAGVTALLADVADVELVRTVEDAAALLAAVAELEPDAVLTDIRMPPSFTDEGIAAARQIRATHPAIGVLVLSQYAEPEYAAELLEDGVAGLGYLLKERVSQVDELTRALRDVARGGSALDPKIVEILMARKAGEPGTPLPGLTEREREVLAEVATGRNNAAVAAALFMSERAVEKHIGAVFLKLGLTDEDGTNRRVAAVLTFLDATHGTPGS